MLFVRKAGIHLAALQVAIWWPCDTLDFGRMGSGAGTVHQGPCSRAAGNPTLQRSSHSGVPLDCNCLEI